MTEPKVDAPDLSDAGEMIEVIFEDHYGLAIAAFIAGALIVAGIVYLIGTRMTEGEEQNAAD